jgi:signal transduction histidine kinase
LLADDRDTNLNLSRRTEQRMSLVSSVSVMTDVEGGDRDLLQALKPAEEARLELAQRLVNAQEAECRRVGLELHDYIGQSLAMLTTDLERTRRSLTDVSPDTHARLAGFSEKLTNLGHDVANLSHRLHSSKLELLGLAVAVKALSREWAEQYQVQARCLCSGVPDDLTPDVSLCLFRVMQEALHNIAKHSHATKINIELDGISDSLRLTISDNGVGFVQNDARRRPGIGLISMRERLHLIGGRFVITTKPGIGTRIEAIAPMTKTLLAIVQPGISSAAQRQDTWTVV